MAISFPTSLDSFPNPTSTDLLENATAALDHDVQHSNANDAIEALQAKVGANSSAVTTSHDYKLSGITGSDKAVSKTGTETLTNKTLTAPQINFGSDANGDIFYRNGSGVTARLAIGSTDQILAVQSGLPAWIANPSATAASSTAAGIVELATTAETTTGTDATRAVTPQGLHDMTSLSGAAWFLDEDTMSSDSATKTASQQSIKAYVDARSNVKIAPVTVVSSTSATDLLSYSVVGGTLGTSGVIRFKIPFWKIKKAGAAAANALQVKFGATTLISINTDSNAATYTDDVGHIEGFICGNTATNSQRAWIFFKHGQSNTTSTTVTSFESTATGTSAEDSTATKTLSVVWSNGTNSANDYIYTMPGLLQITS